MTLASGLTAVALLTALTWSCSPSVLHGGHLRSTPAISAEPAISAIAGTYRRGDECFWSESLTIANDGCFERHFAGCTGESNGAGRVIVSGDSIELPDAGWMAGPRAFDGDADGVFCIVRWGERLYLIEEAQMLRFCNRVNSGYEPSDRPGSFFVRTGDRLEPTTGLPVVPIQWADFVLPIRLEGTVIALLGEQTAWIDLGADDGLQPGLYLHLHDPGGIQLQVRTVQEERSEVRVPKAYGRVPLAVGMRVTSRAIDHP